MAFSPSSPVTGATLTGLTSPTYTLIADNPPAPNAKQWTVSALGGTQPGVSVNSVGKPFTLSAWKPTVLQTLGPVNPVTGVLKSVPMNEYRYIVRKGVVPLAGQAPKTMIVKISVQVPAGAETNDQNSVLAALSLAIGAINAQSAGVGATAFDGTI